MIVELAQRAYNAAKEAFNSVFGRKKKKKVTPLEQAGQAAGASKSSKKANAKKSKQSAKKAKKAKKVSTIVNAEDVRACIAFFDTLQGEKWRNRAGWRSPLPVPQWWGLGIAESRIVELCLSSNLLTVV